MTGPDPQPRKPVILTVDDDPAVSRAVARDLRRHYGERYRIVRAESGPDALETINELKLRGDAVAVFVADYRMPQMSGIEFLEEAMDIYPLARRVLLTAYADTHAAIDAINVVDLDHYLLKPWDPPEEKLYPVIDGLLEAWRAKPATARSPYTKVIGHRWNPRSWEVRQFLARNQHSFRVVHGRRAQGQATAGRGGPRRAAAARGHHRAAARRSSSRPTPSWRRHARPVHHPVADDVMTSPSSAVAPRVWPPPFTAPSEGLKTVLIESTTTGGQAGRSSRIENYLGFPDRLLGRRAHHRRPAGRPRGSAPRSSPTRKATELDVSGQARTIEFDGRQHHRRPGRHPRHRRRLPPTAGPGCWDNPDDSACNYIGRGVYYGASVSDAADCDGEDVYIVGGANSAGQAAMYHVAGRPSR